MTIEKKDYKKTVNLPKTEFPMKAGLPQRYFENKLLIINKALGLDSFPINRLDPLMKMSPAGI